jgi:GTP-binding protein HflX
MHSARSRRLEAEGSLDDPYVAPVSALTGQGLNFLYAEIDRVLTLDHKVGHVLLGHSDGAALAWLHAHGEVLSEDVHQNGRLIEVRLSDKSAGQFEKNFGHKIVDGTEPEDLAAEPEWSPLSSA